MDSSKKRLILLLSPLRQKNALSKKQKQLEVLF